MEITKAAYSEVYAILNLMSWNSINKIPEKIWRNIENKRDKETELEIDNIEAYQPSEQANILLAVLYRSYFATVEEKEIIQAKEKILYQKEQEKLNKEIAKYNLHKKEESEVESSIVREDNRESQIENYIAMIGYKEPVFIKIKNWVKRFFYK